MTIKDYIKEELLRMIKNERACLETRLLMRGDVYEIACETKFIDKLEDFAKSL